MPHARCATRVVRRYGGAEMYSQVWPSSRESLEWSLFASGDMVRGCVPCVVGLG